MKTRYNILVTAAYKSNDNEWKQALNTTSNILCMDVAIIMNHNSGS